MQANQAGRIAHTVLRRGSQQPFELPILRRPEAAFPFVQPVEQVRHLIELTVCGDASWRGLQPAVSAVMPTSCLREGGESRCDFVSSETPRRTRPGNRPWAAVSPTVETEPSPGRDDSSGDGAGAGSCGATNRSTPALW